MPEHPQPPEAHEPETAGDAGERADGRLDRRTWQWILVSGLLGAAVRIAVLVTKWDRNLLLNDSIYYASQAQQNSTGHWFRDVLGQNPGAEHAPLTSLVLTPASLFTPHEFWQRTTNTVIGIVTVVLLARLAWRMFGRRVGVATGFIAALYPNLWMNDALIMSETISILTVVLALWAAVVHVERFSWRSAAWCGLAVGLAALARSEVLLLAPLFAVIGIRRRPPTWNWLRTWSVRAVVIVVAAVAMLVPWTVYNLGRFDAPVLVSTNAGGALLGANCADAYGGESIGGWSILCLFESGEREGEDAAERSDRWQGEALGYISEHKSRVPLVVAARLLRAADLYGLSDLVRFDVGEERMRWASWAGIATWWVLAPLAVVGWFRQRQRFRWVLVAPALGVFVTTVLFYGGHRLRSPMEPAVVVCAAIALTRSTLLRGPLERMVRWVGR